MGLKDLRVQVFQNTFDAGAVGEEPRKPRSTTLLAAPDPGQISGLRLRTKVHGGFVECSFTFSGTPIECARWQFQYMSEHVEVLHGSDVIWDGLIWQPTYDRIAGAVAVTAYGYWRTLEDQRYDTTSESSVLFQNAVWWALSQIGDQYDWRGSFLDGGISRVTDTGTTVQRRIGSSGLETVREAVELWTNLGDSSGNRYWAGLWGSRFLEVTQEQTSTRWLCRLDQMASCTFSTSRSDVWNSVVVSYQDTADGQRKLTPAAEDETSMRRHGIRDLLYPAGELSATAANQLRDLLLERLKDPRQKTTLGLKGSVLDSGMTERPLWLVRAGDILEAVDLDIPDQPRGTVVLGLNKWLIRETVYDADSDSLEVVPDEEEQNLETVVSQALESLIRLPASTEAYSPLQLQDLLWWGSADYGTYQDDDLTTAAQLDGDVVGGLVDRSGQGNHFLQATTGNKPTLQLGEVNGLPVIRGDGTDDYLATAAPVSTSQVSVTWIIVGACGAAKNGPYFKNGDSSTGYGLGIGNGDWDTAGGKVTALREGIAWEDTGDEAGTDPHVYELILQSDENMLIYMDGVLIHDGGADVSSAATATYLLGYTGVRFLAGDFCEGVCIGRDMTLHESERSRERHRLGSKWGITVV